MTVRVKVRVDEEATATMDRVRGAATAPGTGGAGRDRPQGSGGAAAGHPPLAVRDRVVAVIPAYNEAQNIAQVLRALLQVDRLDEVVVVNDGSTDGTGEVARSFGVRVIDLACNQGKGAALKAGAEAAPSDVLLFLDADLVGLTPEHVQELIEPILAGEAEATVGIFEGGRAPTELAQTLTPFLSGQRALRRELLEPADEWGQSGYGVELQLHRRLRRLGKEPKVVVLRDVTQVMKEEKLGLVKGFAARMRMYWEILREIPRG